MNAAAEGVTSVPEGIKAHGLFFDHLVELVPVKYYYDEGDKVNLRFLAKGAKVVAKQQVSDKPWGLVAAFSCTEVCHMEMQPWLCR